MKRYPKSRPGSGWTYRLSAFGYSLILVLLAVLPLTACQETEKETVAVAAYGTFGSDLARHLAASWPNRSPGSAEEKSAGDYLIDSLKKLGYQPIVTSFSFQDMTGQTLTSRNITVVIPGRGFTLPTTGDQVEILDRQVIIGAHYDTAISAADVEADRQTAESSETQATPPAGTMSEPTLADYDGIHDNASGVGALLTLAKELRGKTLGYDVVLIAFGAGEAAQAGSAFYVSQMTKADLSRTDAMYCLDSIYAGDKMYAHSGQNSVRSGYQKNYEMRRKLYEVTDVFYDYELYTQNNYMLYTNQASFDVTLEGIGGPVLYREWTLNESDYRPFDRKNIPIVFFESYDYDEKTLEAMKESNNPAFSATGGAIRHTRFDSYAYLSQIFTQTRTVTSAAGTKAEPVSQLTKRINNTAFIILEAIMKGISGATIR